MKIVTINGIGTSQGVGNTDSMGHWLRVNSHIPVADIDYPWVWAVRAGLRSVQFDRARYLFDGTQDGDVVVAHSFGCLLTRRAMQMGRRFSAVFLFGPADSADTYFPYWGAEKIYVIHNPRDRAIFLGMILPGHAFGGMGRVGCLTSQWDRRVRNIEAYFRKPFKLGHGFYFESSELARWGQFVHDKSVPFAPRDHRSVVRG